MYLYDAPGEYPNQVTVLLTLGKVEKKNDMFQRFFSSCSLDMTGIVLGEH